MRSSVICVIPRKRAKSYVIHRKHFALVGIVFIESLPVGANGKVQVPGYFGVRCWLNHSAAACDAVPNSRS